jgi:hypothetical protein
MMCQRVPRLVIHAMAFMIFRPRSSSQAVKERGSVGALGMLAAASAKKTPAPSMGFQ